MTAVPEGNEARHVATEGPKRARSLVVRRSGEPPDVGGGGAIEAQRADEARRADDPAASVRKGSGRGDGRRHESGDACDADHTAESHRRSMRPPRSPYDAPMTPAGRPSSLVVVHGAGSGPWVYDGWAAALPGIDPVTVDLQDGLDVSRASHDDYANVVVAAADEAPKPVALCGWSMGGLVVLQAAQRVRPAAVILLEASPPAEVQGFDESIEVVDGAFDPEAVYGRFPDGMRGRPESTRARLERKRGISVPSLPCPSLVVYGDDFPDERGSALARLYGSDERFFPGSDHWALVRNLAVPRAIGAWLGD